MSHSICYPLHFTIYFLYSLLHNLNTLITFNISHLSSKAQKWHILLLRLEASRRQQAANKVPTLNPPKKIVRFAFRKTYTGSSRSLQLAETLKVIKLHKRVPPSCKWTSLSTSIFHVSTATFCRMFVSIAALYSMKTCQMWKAFLPCNNLQGSNVWKKSGSWRLRGDDPWKSTSRGRKTAVTR